MRRALAFLLFTLVGCARHSVTVERPPLMTIPQEMPSDGAPIGFVDVVDVRTGKGFASNPPVNFEENIVRKITEANVFSNVVTTRPVGDTGVVTLRFNAQENLDTHDDSNNTKAFLVGATIFVLMPVVPFSYDYGLRLSLDAMCPDGQTRQYLSNGFGSASAYGINEMQPTIVDLCGTVLDRTLTDVVAKLSGDRAFYLACSARKPTVGATH